MKKNTKTQKKLNVGARLKGIPLRRDTTVPLKSQKGITLIALVITIVVLLILAGVTLSIVFNGGIIDKSQNAVDKYSQAQQNETEILDYIDKQFGQISGILENKKIIEDKDYSYNNPVVPVGFKTVNTETASWEVVEDATLGKVVKGWNDGLVIEDSKGNQFVWVPVDGTNVTYDRKLFAKNADDIKNAGISSLSDDTSAIPVSNETTQITKYGGFYIARYEAGIPTDDSNLTAGLTTASVDARNKSGTPVSKKNQVPWNYIDYTTSKVNAKRMYSSNYVKSGLVTGIQWDTTMKWLENSSVDVQTDSTSWGNYKNAPVSGITEYSTNYGASWTITNSQTKETSTSWLLKTGHTNYTSRNNIYDLAGNLWEWSNEIYSSSRVSRGGRFGNNDTRFPASCRYYDSVDYTDSGVGFRCVLYVQ